VDVGAVLVAGAEALEGVQPGEAALDHPALATQAGAAGHAAAGDPRRDAALAQLSGFLAAGLELDSRVCIQAVRSKASELSLYGRQTRTRWAHRNRVEQLRILPRTLGSEQHRCRSAQR
jgi:hypothetical protein